MGGQALKIWSLHVDGNAHIEVTEKLEEISTKLDEMPDAEDIEKLVAAAITEDIDRLSEEIQKSIAPALTTAIERARRDLP